jgi:hypothetical protein
MLFKVPRGAKPPRGGAKPPSGGEAPQGGAKPWVDIFKNKISDFLWNPRFHVVCFANSPSLFKNAQHDLFLPCSRNEGRLFGPRLGGIG